MINLLVKDFKLLFAKETTRKGTILSWIFSALMMIIFLLIETFIFYSVLNKIKNYDQAPVAFLGTFLFIISILMIFGALIQAKKLFFNDKDIQSLSSFPIPSANIVFSKLILLWIIQCAFGLLFTYPLFVSYGIVFKKVVFYYYIVLFYPFLMCFFQIGIALILLYPFKWITDFLKTHLLLQFFFSLLFSFGFCFLYKEILDLFVSLLANNQLESIFSISFLNFIISLKKYIVPINFLMDVMILSKGRSFLYFFCISVGVLFLGLTIAIYAYHRFCKNSFLKSPKEHHSHPCKIRSLNRALIHKELILLLKNTDHLFSFNNLLVVQPFLAYLVISSLNRIFSIGSFTYYLTFLPNFIPLLDILLVILFSLTIGQGANQFIRQEGKNTRLMKYIPVLPLRQLFFKVIIPFAFSSISLFVTYIVLLATSTISLMTFFFGFILCEILLTLFILISLMEELKQSRNHTRTYLFTNIYSYLLPTAYFVLTMILSYFGVSAVLIYLLGILLFALLGLPFVIHLKRKLENLFMDLEVIN